MQAVLTSQKRSRKFRFLALFCEGENQGDIRNPAKIPNPPSTFEYIEDGLEIVQFLWAPMSTGLGVPLDRNRQ